jgi:hypothetical protein
MAVPNQIVPVPVWDQKAEGYALSQYLACKRLVASCTNQKSILFFHAVGSGKSLTSLCVAFNVPGDKKFSLITIDGLETAFSDEYDKMKEWYGQEKADAVLDVQTNDGLTSFAFKRLFYEDLFSKMLDLNINNSKYTEFINDHFTNKVLILDEAHKILQLLNRDRTGKFEQNMLYCFRQCYKVVFLTATPIQKDWSDFGKLIKIIAKLNNPRVLNTFRSFDERAFKKEFWFGWDKSSQKMDFYKTVLFQESLKLHEWVSYKFKRLRESIGPELNDTFRAALPRILSMIGWLVKISGKVFSAITRPLKSIYNKIKSVLTIEKDPSAQDNSESFMRSIFNKLIGILKRMWSGLYGAASFVGSKLSYAGQKTWDFVKNHKRLIGIIALIAVAAALIYNGNYQAVLESLKAGVSTVIAGGKHVFEVAIKGPIEWLLFLPKRILDSIGITDAIQYVLGSTIVLKLKAWFDFAIDWIKTAKQIAGGTSSSDIYPMDIDEMSSLVSPYISFNDYNSVEYNHKIKLDNLDKLMSDAGIKTETISNRKYTLQQYASFIGTLSDDKKIIFDDHLKDLGIVGTTRNGKSVYTTAQYQQLLIGQDTDVKDKLDIQMAESGIQPENISNRKYTAKQYISFIASMNTNDKDALNTDLTSYENELARFPVANIVKVPLAMTITQKMITMNHYSKEFVATMAELFYANRIRGKFIFDKVSGNHSFEFLDSSYVDTESKKGMFSALRSIGNYSVDCLYYYPISYDDQLSLTTESHSTNYPINLYKYTYFAYELTDELMIQIHGETRGRQLISAVRDKRVAQTPKQKQENQVVEPTDENVKAVNNVFNTVLHTDPIIRQPVDITQHANEHNEHNEHDGYQSDPASSPSTPRSVGSDPASPRSVGGGNPWPRWWDNKEPRQITDRYREMKETAPIMHGKDRNSALAAIRFFESADGQRTLEAYRTHWLSSRPQTAPQVVSKAVIQQPQTAIPPVSNEQEPQTAAPPVSDEQRQGRDRYLNNFYDHFEDEINRKCEQEQSELARQIVPKPHLSSIFGCEKFNAALNLIIQARTQFYHLPVVYSNFEENGLYRFSAFLTSMKLPHIVITPETQKDEDYKATKKSQLPYLKWPYSNDIHDHRINWLNDYSHPMYLISDYIIHDQPCCVLVHPSLQEGLSLVKNEVMICLETMISFGNQEQVYGRVIRSYSDKIKKEYEYTKQLYSGALDDDESINEYILNYSNPEYKTVYWGSKLTKNKYAVWVESNRHLNFKSVLEKYLTDKINILQKHAPAYYDLDVFNADMSDYIEKCRNNENNSFSPVTQYLPIIYESGNIMNSRKHKFIYQLYLSAENDVKNTIMFNPKEEFQHIINNELGFVQNLHAGQKDMIVNLVNKLPGPSPSMMYSVPTLYDFSKPTTTSAKWLRNLNNFYISKMKRTNYWKIHTEIFYPEIFATASELMLMKSSMDERLTYDPQKISVIREAGLIADASGNRTPEQFWITQVETQKVEIEKMRLNLSNYDDSNVERLYPSPAAEVDKFPNQRMQCLKPEAECIVKTGRTGKETIGSSCNTTRVSGGKRKRFNKTYRKKKQTGGIESVTNIVTVPSSNMQALISPDNQFKMKMDDWYETFKGEYTDTCTIDEKVADVSVFNALILPLLKKPSENPEEQILALFDAFVDENTIEEMKPELADFEYEHMKEMNEQTLLLTDSNVSSSAIQLIEDIEANYQSSNNANDYSESLTRLFDTGSNNFVNNNSTATQKQQNVMHQYSSNNINESSVFNGLNNNM